jgi:hypothetical protein
LTYRPMQKAVARCASVRDDRHLRRAVAGGRSALPAARLVLANRGRYGRAGGSPHRDAPSVQRLEY